MAKKSEPKKITYHRVLTIWSNGQQLTLAASTAAQAERLIRDQEDVVSRVTGGAVKLVGQEVTVLKTWQDPTAWPFRTSETHAARSWPARGLEDAPQVDPLDLERQQLGERLAAKAKVSEKRKGRLGSRSFPTAEELEQLDAEARARVADLNRENVDAMQKTLSRDTWETSMTRAAALRRRQAEED